MIKYLRVIIMNYTKGNIKELFNYWNNKIAEYSLPTWEELPLFDLYMDQVITLINNYLSIYSEATGDERGITQSMINNYVKLKIIPAPVKKKYSRVHLAYLIIVCVLKQTLNIATIQNIVPIELSEDEIKQTYNTFVLNQKKSYSYVSANIQEIAHNIFNNEKPERINDLIMQVATSANIFKMMSEIIIGTPDDEKETE